ASVRTPVCGLGSADRSPAARSLALSSLAVALRRSASCCNHAASGRAPRAPARVEGDRARRVRVRGAPRRRGAGQGGQGAQACAASRSRRLCGPRRRLHRPPPRAWSRPAVGLSPHRHALAERRRPRHALPRRSRRATAAHARARPEQPRPCLASLRPRGGADRRGAVGEGPLHLSPSRRDPVARVCHAPRHRRGLSEGARPPAAPRPCVDGILEVDGRRPRGQARLLGRSPERHRRLGSRGPVRARASDRDLVRRVYAGAPRLRVRVRVARELAQAQGGLAQEARLARVPQHHQGQRRAQGARGRRRQAVRPGPARRARPVGGRDPRRRRAQRPSVLLARHDVVWHVGQGHGRSPLEAPVGDSVPPSASWRKTRAAASFDDAAGDGGGARACQRPLAGCRERVDLVANRQPERAP
ncbi:uncharacterized protein RHOBADRAFT_52527, partial [Rhodotorula graminis WP1]